MATSIGSSASFTYGNMKPASGEQIDALWGQNISDNTAFLRAQRQFYTFITRGVVNSDRLSTSCSSGGNNHVETTLSPMSYVCRDAAHNRYVGTVRFDGTHTGATAPDAFGTFGIYFYGDLGTYGGTVSYATANIGAGGFVRGSTLVFELNLDSYLSIGSWGTVIGFFSGTSNDMGGSGDSIMATFQEPKFYTTWAN